MYIGKHPFSFDIGMGHKNNWKHDSCRFHYISLKLTLTNTKQLVGKVCDSEVIVLFNFYVNLYRYPDMYEAQTILDLKYVRKWVTFTVEGMGLRDSPNTLYRLVAARK